MWASIIAVPPIKRRVSRRGRGRGEDRACKRGCDRAEDSAHRPYCCMVHSRARARPLDEALPAAPSAQTTSARRGRPWARPSRPRGGPAQSRPRQGDRARPKPRQALRHRASPHRAPRTRPPSHALAWCRGSCDHSDHRWLKKRSAADRAPQPVPRQASQRRARPTSWWDASRRGRVQSEASVRRLRGLYRPRTLRWSRRLHGRHRLREKHRAPSFRADASAVGTPGTRRWPEPRRVALQKPSRRGRSGWRGDHQSAGLSPEATRSRVKANVSAAPCGAGRAPFARATAFEPCSGGRGSNRKVHRRSHAQRLRHRADRGLGHGNHNRPPGRHRWHVPSTTQSVRRSQGRWWSPQAYEGRESRARSR